MTIRLGDIAPDFEQDSSAGRIRFHEWLGASWGVLISDGARAIQATPWMLAFPAAFLVTTLFALNFLGDGLRDALDPRDR